jgi:membrane protease YdiL (CAAX protease family)
MRAEPMPRQEEFESPALPLILAEPDVPFWGFGEVFLAIAIFLVAVWLIAGLVASVIHDSARLGYWVVGEEFAAYVVLFGILKILFRMRGHALFESLGWVRQPFSPLSLALTGFALVLISFALQILLRTPDVETPFSKMLESGWGSRLAISLFGVTIAPVVEELLFRGFLQPVLVSAAGVFPGILATSVLFGAVHLTQNAGLWQAGLTITVAGFAFGVVRHISGSTRASSIVHIAYNLVPFVLTLLFPHSR